MKTPSERADEFIQSVQATAEREDFEEYYTPEAASPENCFIEACRQSQIEIDYWKHAALFAIGQMYPERSLEKYIADSEKAIKEMQEKK